jgi:hypothetical protein
LTLIRDCVLLAALILSAQILIYTMENLQPTAAAEDVQPPAAAAADARHRCLYANVRG